MAAATTAPNPTQARHRSQPSPISATPATQNARPCRQVPRLPRKVTVDVVYKYHACHVNGGGDHGAKPNPSAPPEPAQSDKCHACHAECTPMSLSATPATQSDGRCRQVYHACHANGGGDHGAKLNPSAPPEPTQSDMCHACHAECTSMSLSATGATQNDGRCPWSSCVWTSCVVKLCVSKLSVGKLCGE